MAILVAVPTFAFSWWWIWASYGFWGLIFGWIPAVIFASLAGALSPLIILLVLGIGAYLLYLNLNGAS